MTKRDSEVKKQLPGWRVAKRDIADAPVEPDHSKVRPGPSVGDLRRKFLTDEELAADANSDGGVEEAVGVDPGRDTFQVASEEGGETKEAEIYKGKARIVQG
jgi:hypothetical protein